MNNRWVVSLLVLMIGMGGARYSWSQIALPHTTTLPGLTTPSPSRPAASPHGLAGLSRPRVSPASAISVTGAVRQPGVYPWQPHMRFRDFLLAAGGFTKPVEALVIRVLRLSPDGTRTFAVNARSALQGTDEPALQAGDQLIVEEVASAPLATDTARAERRRGPADALSPVEDLLAGVISHATKPLRQFGYDLFRDIPTTFAPVTDVPVGPDYVIGSGDAFTIVLWGSVQETLQVRVNREGAIILPRLGVVHVAGMSMQQLEVFLRQRFAAYYQDFQMSLSLSQLRSMLVYVIGAVKLPGAYTVSALSTMLNALFASGGPTKNGSLRQIRLVRGGQTLHTFDLYQFLLQGDKSGDRTLQAGDTVFVPVIGAVAGVAGNVRRPAIYEITGKSDLRQLLRIAGGVAPSGYLQRVHVERFKGHAQKVVMDLDLSAAETSKRWRTPIRDGDLITVFPVDNRLENAVELSGHVKRPGRYELKPGMRLRHLLPSYDDVLPQPYLPYGEIVRHLGPEMRQVVVPFNVRELLAGEAAHNIALQPHDLVRVFAHSDFVDPAQVRISGLVHQPGIYALAGPMRVRDLIMRAGNVRNFAYLSQAEITRRQDGQTGGEAVRIEVNLERALAGDAEHNIVLQNFDHLLVRQQPNVVLESQIELSDRTRAIPVYPLVPGDEKAAEALRRAGGFVEQTIRIAGEVQFPGTYPILKGERLSAVLRRAGGFTDNAYLPGIVFTRRSVRNAQEKRLRELLQVEEQALLAESAAVTGAALSVEEVQGQSQALSARRQLLNQLRAVRPEGRIVVRLGPLETFAGSEQDIELQPGDRIQIPQIPKYINVLGQVYNAAALLYEPGKDLAFYLEQVGGMTRDANEKEVHVVQVDGTVISKRQDQFLSLQTDGRMTYLGDFYSVQPRPGDTIVVPRRVHTPATLRHSRDIVQIIFQSISTLGVIAALL